MDRVMITSPAGQFFYGMPNVLSEKLSEFGNPCQSQDQPLHAIELAKGMRNNELSELCVKMKGKHGWPLIPLDTQSWFAYYPHHIEIMKTAPIHLQVCGIIFRQIRTMMRKRLAFAFVTSFLVPAILNILLLVIYGAFNHDSRVGDVVLVCFGGMLAAAQPMIWRAHYDREQFFDEYNHGCYEVWAFLMAKLALELLQGLVQAVVASLASHYMLGLTGLLPVYMLTITILGLVFTSTSLCFMEITRYEKLGGLMALLIFFLQLLFTGVFYHVSQIPDWLRWIQYVCPLKHAMNVLAHFEFVYANEETELADKMQENLDLPKHWWVSALALVLFVLILQCLAGFKMWIQALRVSEAGMRWRTWTEVINDWFLNEGTFGSGIGTQMAPPCKRDFMAKFYHEYLVDV